MPAAADAKISSTAVLTQEVFHNEPIYALEMHVACEQHDTAQTRHRGDLRVSGRNWPSLDSLLGLHLAEFFGGRGVKLKNWHCRGECSQFHQILRDTPACVGSEVKLPKHRRGERESFSPCLGRVEMGNQAGVSIEKRDGVVGIEEEWHYRDYSR